MSEPTDNLPPKKKLDLSGLKAALDSTVTWPDVYAFKFIVPRAHVNHVYALIDGHRYTERESSSGRFVAITVEAMMTSSDDVVAFYERVSVVEGIMAL
jgi:uncharacterized protein